MVDLAELGVRLEAEAFQEQLVHQEEVDRHHEVVDNVRILEEVKVRHMVDIRDNRTAQARLEAEGTLDNHLEEGSQASSLGKEVGLQGVHLVEVGAGLEERLGWLLEVAGLAAHRGVVGVVLLAELLEVAGILQAARLEVDILLVLLGVAGTVLEERHQAAGSSRDSSLGEVGNNQREEHQEEHQEVAGKAIAQEDW